MAQHTLPDDILAEYVAGTLPEAFDLVIAAQASLDAGTRARIGALERIGGALLDAGAAADIGADSLAATLALIRSGAPAPDAPPLRRSCPVLPGPVCDYVGGTLADVRWRPLGMGAKQAILATSGEASARLLHIPAGCEMPDHGHNGREITLVLQGAFLDDGLRYARGDVEVADESLEHRPTADQGEDCICLAACEGALRFSGLLPRIAQPFLKI